MMFIPLIPTLIGAVVLVIGVAMLLREQGHKERKMAELEVALAEAKEKIAAMETHGGARQQVLPLKGAD
jgi:Mg2+/citrate symporter